MEEWRIHINKICCEKFLLNKKISTFFRRKWEKSCTLGILSYLRRIYAFFRVALVPPTNFFIFSVSLHEVVLFGCSIAPVTRKFIFADFLGVKVGYFAKIFPFWRFLTIFLTFFGHTLVYTSLEMTWFRLSHIRFKFCGHFYINLGFYGDSRFRIMSFWRYFELVLSLFWALWGLIFAYSGGHVYPKCLKCLGNWHGRMKNSY